MYYLLTVGIVSACVFCIDKYKAINGKWRISESMLHGLELLGGVFFIVPLMYIIHHKNSKFSYYAVSYVILALWIALLCFGAKS